MSRASELVQPGVLRLRGEITIRVEHKGRNVGILVVAEDGRRRYFQAEYSASRHAVELIEVRT